MEKGEDKIINVVNPVENASSTGVNYDFMRGTSGYNHEEYLKSKQFINKYNHDNFLKDKQLYDRSRENEGVFGPGSNDYGRKKNPLKSCPAHAEASDAIEVEYNHAKPAHYELWDGMEDTFAIHKAALTYEEFGGFLKGNILKYKLRIGDKPDTPVERDILKVAVYREEYTKLLKRGNI